MMRVSALILAGLCAFLGLSGICVAEVTENSSLASISLCALGSFRSPDARFNTSAAEIAAYDPRTKRLFVANIGDKRIEILDISNLPNVPSNPAECAPETAYKRQYMPKSVQNVYVAGEPRSVAVHNRILAVAVAKEPITDNGEVLLFDAACSGETCQPTQITVGPAPDMLTFTPNGRRLLVANTGELDESTSVDPDGSVSIIDVEHGAKQARLLATADFRAFNGDAQHLNETGANICTTVTVAQDLEPEFITVSKDSRRAWISLEPNNALALLDVKTSRISKLLPLGFKDHNEKGNELDANNTDGINITAWPIYGMYQSDGIASYTIAGKTYVVTANEGKWREEGPCADAARVRDLPLDSALSPFQADTLLGRLRVSGRKRINASGEFERLYAFGARSFSIWSEDGWLFNGGAIGEHVENQPVFDSGAQFEQEITKAFPAYFNIDDTDIEFDNKSRNSGPEPDGVAIGRISGRTYAFIVLDRQGGVMVYDVSDPERVRFVEYVNTRNLPPDRNDAIDPKTACTKGEVPTGPCLETGDLGPEGVLFIGRAESPNHRPALVVTNQTSGTTAFYLVRKH